MSIIAKACSPQWQKDYDKLFDCWEFHKGLNKFSFTPAKLVALPPHLEALAYTDTSILFRIHGTRKYAYYDHVLCGWVVENAI